VDLEFLEYESNAIDDEEDDKIDGEYLKDPRSLGIVIMLKL
jgi:hypothetical protein